MEKEEILGRIEKVMHTEATKPDEHDFLLTHVPFRNLSLGETIPITEEELYEEKLLANPEKHKTIMVLGENGSGKSHLVRWLYFKYLREYGENNPKEKILWIPKSHNTLQDALMQLLQSNIFPEEIQKNELEKVRNAQSAISGVDLKKTINFNFTLAIENEISKKGKSKFIDNVTRTMLPYYLKNEYILERFMMKDNGPLDRICAKLNNEDNSKTKEYEGEVFKESDFAITLDDLKNHLEGGDGKVTADSHTLALARKLRISPNGKLQQSLAAYMNSKVNEVIQRSLKYQSSDFKQLFWSLRSKLKEGGMRLTLFVEDINSFTGIDLALIDVLVADHETQGNEEYCRLASVVGTTTDFYKNRLNDSLRDRVKDVGAEVYIREESLFGDQDRLVEFAARYINACMISDEEAISWENDSNCDEDSLPIAQSPYNFSREKCFGREMSIFPFNRTAICNMYEKLDSLSKTPRRFILEVLYPVLTLYYTSPDDFLDKESAFKNDSITSLNDFKKPDYKLINDQVDGKDVEKRSLLLRLWGDGTTEVYDGNLGGLDREIFDAFGVDMMFNQFKEFMGSDVKNVASQGLDINQPQKAVSQKKTGSSTQADSKTDIKNTKKTKDTTDETYSKIEKSIGEWAKNPEAQLAYAPELRKLISAFIYGNMEWDVEQIPRTIIEAFINTTKYINIEGQVAAIRDDSFMIKRSQESEYLFYALARYKYLGDNSWNFESGFDYYSFAMTWLLNHREDILKLVTAPYESAVSYEESLLASLYCVKLFNGGINSDQSAEDALFSLFDEHMNYSAEHCEAWNSIYSQVLNALQIEDSIKYSQKVRVFFSNMIGTANTNTDYTFVDAHRLVNITKKMMESRWDLMMFNVPIEKKNSQDFWYKAPRAVGVVSRNTQNLITYEMDRVRTYTTYFKRRIPSYTETKQIEQVLEAVRKYLRYILDKRNLGYDEKMIPMLSSPQVLSKSSIYARELSILNEILKADSNYDRIKLISLNPLEHISSLYKELQYIDQLIKEKNDYFKAGIDVSVNQQIDITRSSIQMALNRMIIVGQGGE